MKKALFALCLLTGSLFADNGIYDRNFGYILQFQHIAYDQFVLHLDCPAWQPRAYYHGVYSGSIGYFHVNNWDGTVNIFGSNRYASDLESFFQSLMPFETNLLPYITANSAPNQLISTENATISGLPAKKLTFEVGHEIVICYIFTTTHFGLFSDSGLGCTYAISCEKSKADHFKIDEIAQKLQMR